MAYRYEKTTNGQDLVIDGFEQGIAESPFDGIGNMRNVSIQYYKGLAYVNYKRTAATIQSSGGSSSRNVTITIASPAVFTAVSHGLYVGNVMTFSTTGTLPTGITADTPYFVVSTPTADTFTVSATPGGSAVNTSGSQSGTQTYTMSMYVPAFSCQSQDGIIYISDTLGNIYYQTSANGSIFRILPGCPGTPSYGLQWWNNSLLAWTDTALNIYDGTWNTGSGTGGVWPIKNASLLLTAATSAGDISATLSSYTDAQGNSRAFWNGPTGTYPLAFTGQTVFATLTQGSSAISWYPALNANNTNSPAVQPVRTSTNKHPSIVSINDGLCYFGNKDYVSSLEVLPNQSFSKSDFKSFNFNGVALQLPQTEIVLGFTELRNNLLIGVAYKIYPWDRFSPQWSNPIPLPEYFNSMINILNNVYITAGNKGYIYISNGYNAERFVKLPDNISGGLIDPTWSWGGIMTHRQRLWVQALATNAQSSSPALSGIFSIDLDTKSINMESQNSFGLVQSNTLANGLLIDNNSITLGYDNYYSAWASGGDGGIDYNDTTLWSGGEAIIETDMVPIGTAVIPKTFSSAEFKLDQPLQSGDSISLYARQSLSDSYTLIGTTSTAVLSELYQSVSFESWQWIQFKVVLTCNPTSTSSSFDRIREVRIR